MDDVTGLQLTNNLEFTSRIIGIEATFSIDDTLGHDSNGIHTDFDRPIKVLKQLKLMTDSDNCELVELIFSPL